MSQLIGVKMAFNNIKFSYLPKMNKKDIGKEKKHNIHQYFISVFIIVVISVWAKQKHVHIGSIVLVSVHCTGSTSDFSNHWTSGLSWRRQIRRVSPCICQSCCLFLWWSEWHSWQPNHIFCAWVAYVTCGIRYASYERKWLFFFICKDLQDMSAIFLLWQYASIKPLHLLFIPTSQTAIMLFVTFHLRFHV